MTQICVGANTVAKAIDALKIKNMHQTIVTLRVHSTPDAGKSGSTYRSQA